MYGCVVVCFFFFKQKTAYEMRISDWSSDVCSSDLTWLRSIPCPRSAGPNSVCGCAGSCATTGPLPGERSRGPRRAVGFRRTYGRGRATARPDAGHPQLVSNLLDDPAYPQSHLARQHTSEEHTSDLQSLMRTSYAFSCLTK